jgi:hypothetical protein
MQSCYRSARRRRAKEAALWRDETGRGRTLVRIMAPHLGRAVHRKLASQGCAMCDMQSM